jgi:flagellar basal-body rod protein FlgG
VTAEGEYVLDTDGQPIVLENGNQVPLYRLNVVTFSNPGGLEAIGHNRFVETQASGPALNWGVGAVKQGFLEASNVDLAEEMAQLIMAQRVYQLSSRVIQSADEMERLANNLRG